MGDEKLYARKTRKDEISVQKHIEWLQKEYKIKEGKEMLLVDQLMDINPGISNCIQMKLRPYH
jgi:hypothetical protein